MQDLQSLETFEMEILELLSNAKLLDSIYFGGETMLRLCHNLNRFSTDLDFWIDSNTDSKHYFSSMKKILSESYSITDSMNKKNTLLFEIKSSHIKRRLKIEIRKVAEKFEWERNIAFSSFTNKQVLVKALTLQQMMLNKIESFLSRKIIRDCFDIEFLFMRGVELKAETAQLQAMKSIISGFKERDYKVTLGSILDEKDKKFYIERNFLLLHEEINKKIFEAIKKIL